MLQKNNLSVASVVLCCLAAPLILSCLAGPTMAGGTQTREQFYQQIESAIDNSVYFVAYDKKTGQPTEIIASPGMTVLREGESLSTELLDVLKELEALGEKVVETQCETSFYVHGSPGCRIKQTASGAFKVICN